MTLEEHLAVPYVLVLESVVTRNGSWVRQASYPELPGCVAQAPTPIEAIDLLEEQKVRCIAERLRTGQGVPVPRPPLQTGRPLDAQRLRFARWLRDTDRISDQR